MELCSAEALRYVWEGAIPLQIHLHESEVTTLPSPPPAMVLAPRMGYLPLLVSLIKPHFSSTLPPGIDTVWFDYKGLPLKWYIPTGVLFDLLCAEPERPWNITVHFRGHPGEILTPCEGEDNVKWSFINSLKEATYLINGNCKNVMNMSQADQFELWQSLVKGDMDGYHRISSRLKLGPLGEDCIVRPGALLVQPRQAVPENDTAGTGSNRASRIPVRLYVRSVNEDVDDLEDAVCIDDWDCVSYINRPVEIQKHEGNYSTLKNALESLLPGIFEDEPSAVNDILRTDVGYPEVDSISEDSETTTVVQNAGLEEASCTRQPSMRTCAAVKLKLIRIQGIELDLNIPFFWVVNNLMHPDFFLHICIFLGVSSQKALPK